MLEDHAYGLLKVIEIKGHKLLNLRNPWGKIDWNGDWSPQSDKWTDEIKNELEVGEEISEDNFWMSFPDFIENFDVIYVCKIANWTESR